MKVLGLHVTGDQSSACIVEDGVVTHAVAEERLNREKRSRKFPEKAIQWCMQSSGMDDLGSFDSIAVAWNPMRHMELMNMSGFTSWRRYDPEWLYIVPNNLQQFIKTSIDGSATRLSWGAGFDQKLNFVDHHLCHIAHAAFQSNFRDCAVLIADEYGEFSTATMAMVKDGKVDEIMKSPFPHSLGAFYATITEYLGFRKNSDEWKVMGMAAYGDPKKYYKEIKSLIHWNAESLELTLNLKYFEHFNMKVSTYYSPYFRKLFDFAPRLKSDELAQGHYDFAASAQRVFEEIVFAMLNSLHDSTGCPNLVMGGGCIMNSLLNGQVLDNTKFKEMFITYAPADNGGAIGAAMWTCHQAKAIKLPVKNYEPPTPYLGPTFSLKQIEETIKKFKIPYHKGADFIDLAAGHIVEGKIVGWFQGALEFGERALGNRSILADPRNVSMKDTVNAVVKYREHFRPFAPAILEEKAADYFEMPRNVRVPYMEQVYAIKPDKRDKVAAVTHQDGTGRLQTVSKKTNPLFHALISKFGELTDVPVLLNTSFNVQGEPIVCSPEDAIRTFFSCGMDVLVIGDCLIVK